jgi:tetratricopeptide (TPR) repeat protein
MKPFFWLIKIAVWFAAIGERILVWCLRRWACLLALPCMGLVLLTKWVAFTLSKRIEGMHLPLLGDPAYASGHVLLSYGLVAAGLFALGGLAYTLKLWRVLAGTGAAMLLLTLIAVLQIAFVHCSLLNKLLEEETQAKAANQFNQYYLPSNGGTEASDAIGIAGMPTETVWYRLLSTWYFMGFGWYVAVAGGLCAFSYAVCRLRSGRERLLIAGATVAAAVVLISVCSARPLLAHVTLVKAERAESKGNPGRAIQAYRKAIRLDNWYAIRPDLYWRIGAIQFGLGQTSTFEYGMYHAELLLAEKNYSAAVAEYQSLVLMADAPKELLTLRTYQIWIDYGMQLYAAGALGDAVDAWEHVVVRDRTQWLAIYCVATAYFNTGRYQESVDLILGLLKGLADPQLRANLHSSLGDAYTRLGDYQKAKLAYRFSYSIDNVLNWRALMSLVGS